MKLARFISVTILTALISSLYVPVYSSTEITEESTQIAEEEKKLSGLAVNRIEIQDNILTVKGNSEADVTAALIRPGKEYLDIETEQLFEVVSDMDCFKSENGIFTVEFYEENVENGYSLFISNGENQIELEVKELSNSDVIYVSPDGDDANDGSKNAPLKTLDAARIMVREKKSFGKEISVVLEAGVYDYESVEFGLEDSGFEDIDIKYIAKGAEFKGTKEIPFSQFKKVTDASILGKLKKNVADKIIAADLSKSGLTAKDVDFLSSHSAGESISELGVYVDSKRQMLSRYPNDGYMYIDEIINGGGQKRNSIDEGVGAEFYQYDSNLNHWETARNAYAAGFLGVEYFSEWAKIDSVDGSLSTVKFADWTEYGVKKGYRWYITNLIEEIDIPGEWYIDKDAMMIYYFPAEDFGEDSKFEIAVQTEPLISINGASNIDFSGFKIFGTKSDGIKITNGENISVNNFDISHTKGYGINMSGNNITVDGCTIYNTYDAGIYVKSGGNRNTLTGSGNVISNNHIYKTGTDSGSNWHGGIYIAANNVGTVVRNNLIHGIKNYSYSFGGNENLFCYNEVWNGNRETADSGPTYCGRQLNEYGNKLSYNYIHDCVNFMDDAQYGNHAINTGDDWQSGTIIENNIMHLGKKEKTSATGTHSRDNIIRYNISVDSGAGVDLSDRYKWVPDMLNTTKDAVATLLNSLEQGEGLQKGFSKTEVWQNKYPQISTIYDDIVANDGRFRVVNNVVTDNISVDAPNSIDEIYYDETYNNVIENNKEFDDYSIFVDADNHDYRITREAMEKYNLDEHIINEDNFSMNEIGIQKTMNTVSSEFNLTYPYNNSTQNVKDICLVWTEADFADEYLVEVAKDANFENIVYSDKTIYNRIYPEGLSSDTQYYWRVRAKNLSKQIGNVWLSENGVCSFTTTGGEVDADGSSFKKTDDKAVINVCINNRTSHDVVDADMYFAFYGEDGSLKGVNVENCSLKSGKTLDEIYEYSYTQEFSAVKMFLWNKSMIPITTSPIMLYERQYIVGEEYEITDFKTIGSGWTNRYLWFIKTIWYSNTKGDSVVFDVETPNAGKYDLYYWVEKPLGNSSIVSKATAQIETIGGIGGAVTSKTEFDINSAEGYVYLGRYEISAPDGSGKATVTVTNSEGDGCFPAVKLKALRVY